MNILQLCLRVPFPATDGGAIAMLGMARSLTASGAKVKMLCINTPKHFVEIGALPEDFRNEFKTEAVFIDTSVKVVPAFLNLFGRDSYNISRFDSPDFHTALANVLQKDRFDAILLESLFMCPYLDTIRTLTDAPVFLRAHNAEYRIWERLSASAGNLFKKTYLGFLAKRIKKYEVSMLNKMDGVIAISEDDAGTFAQLGCVVRVKVVPVSVDTRSYRLQTLKDGHLHAFHLGSMDWLPNIEGVNWFLKSVFPKLLSKADFVIHFAGKSMPRYIFDYKSPHVEIQGRIDDARRFMSDKQIMIVPLFSGGGMRVKIIEGMAMGKTIISTSVGAEGIACTNGKDILIADDPDEFAQLLQSCFEDPEKCRMLGDNARRLAESHYDIRATGSETIQFIRSFIDKN